MREVTPIGFTAALALAMIAGHATGCSGDPSGSSDAGDADASVAEPADAAPTAPEPPGEQVVVNRTVSDGTRDRTYVAYLPGNYATRTTPAQVVIGFHPARSSGAGFADITKLHDQAGADDVVVVYPDGVTGPSGHRAWNAGFCCTAADDVALFDAIVQDLSSLTAIRPGIAITGYSSGAMMVYRLLCDRPGMLSAAVPFAAYLREQDLADASCAWQTPVPVLHIHGAEDTQMDPDGQMDGYYPDSGIQTLPLVDYMDLVAERNGGSAAAASETSSPELDSTLIHLADETAYTVIAGLGHTWPGAPALGAYGPGRTDTSGSEAVMAFLLGP